MKIQRNNMRRNLKDLTREPTTAVEKSGIVHSARASMLEVVTHFDGDRSAYFYTWKSPNFAFSSSFFISIYLYLRSRDHRIAYTDHTPTISAEHSPTYPEDLQRLTESFRAYPFLIISPSQPRDITEHH